MLFGKKKTKPAKTKPSKFYIYTQEENYRGFTRRKLSSYGYKPAQDGIRALTGVDLTGFEIKVSVYEDAHPRIVVSVGDNEVGSLWKDNFDKFDDFKKGKVEAVRLEVRDGDAYLFYKL